MAAVVPNKKQKHCYQVRVYYEDTDAGGVVYHSQYLNFMERARTEWLRQLGLEQMDLRDDLQIVFVVHSMSIAFKQPAKLDDSLDVTTELEKTGHGSLIFLQKITIDGQLLVQAQVKIACVDALTFKPNVIPKQVLLKLESV